MRVKRSVSPDGRINSLSVEITAPLDRLDPDELARRAREIVVGEGKVIEVFLGTAQANAAATEPNSDAAEWTPAQIAAIGGMNTEWGRRLFLVFQVNGETARVFGSPRKLASLLSSAGVKLKESEIEEGLELNVPCRVTTGRTPDGRFLSIEQVLPASAT
jgi:hypothetical protein